MQDHDTDGFIGGKTDVAIFFHLVRIKHNSGRHILVKEEETLALVVTHL